VLIFDHCIARPLAQEDLPMLLSWRNHLGVRQHMLTQHEITPEEHQHWFDRASQDARRRLYVVEESGVAIGFVHFSGVEPAGVAEWGFYAAPGAPKGSGKKTCATALNTVFGNLMLHKVCGQALEPNIASAGLHRVLGFRQEGRLREHSRMDSGYQDLLCFGLLKREWMAATTARKES
jgi:UDP-4-amino-4,6-dideoxy-N-acetyl-beta-L-altrosamine N-acetyltransferase